MSVYSTDFAVAAAQRYAEGNMTAAVTIHRPSDPALDALTGRVTANELPDVIYQGKARLWPVGGPVVLDLGDEPWRGSNMYVSIPVTTAVFPRVDDLVEVTLHSDPQMVGRVFRVMDVEAGGQFPAVRRMQVTGVQAASEWEL